MSEAKPQTSDTQSKDGGCCGCISLVLMLIAVWAIVFGVTIGGKHYGIRGCDTKNGVVIDR